MRNRISFFCALAIAVALSLLPSTAPAQNGPIRDLRVSVLDVG